MAILNKALRLGQYAIARLESGFDGAYLAQDVPMSQTIAHQKWQKYLYTVGNKKGLRILEIGSREVTGLSEARKQFANAEYVGFDYYPGQNVVAGTTYPAPKQNVQG